MWLAGFAPQDRPPTETDREAMKRVLTDFLAVCPHVYGFDDRMNMWEKIGNAALSSIESCDNDLSVWANGVLVAIGASPGSVASSERVRNALAALAGNSDSWQAECLQTMKQLAFVLPTMARAKWEQYKEDKSNAGNE